MHCMLCGRPLTAPAVLLGNNPVGPKCAARAGLLERARRAGPRGHVRLYQGPRVVRPDPVTLDLFAEVAP
jgi:hypothetical protein